MCVSTFSIGSARRLSEWLVVALEGTSGGCSGASQLRYYTPLRIMTRAKKKLVPIYNGERERRSEHQLMTKF